MKTYAVKILTPAEADAVDAALWYDAQSPGLGAEFMEEVSIAALKLAKNPEIHRLRFEDVRRAPVFRFKFYGLYYLIHGEEVWIMAVHHDCRNPRWLQRRRRQLG